jgi:cob(I)alamin adenosyltransferase
MRIYTKAGDDGTTGLLYGGRIAKDSPTISATGAVDEAQAALGVVRAEVERGSDLDALLISLERDLYVLMAEMTTAPHNRRKLTPAVSIVTVEMVDALEARIDDIAGRFPPITDFVIPGHDRVSALLDVARTAVRRAERLSLSVAPEGSHIVAYLNRLSDLVWAMARWQEHGDSLLSRRAGQTGSSREAGGPSESSDPTTKGRGAAGETTK